MVKKTGHTLHRLGDLAKGSFLYAHFLIHLYNHNKQLETVKKIDFLAQTKLGITQDLCWASLP